VFAYRCFRRVVGAARLRRRLKPEKPGPKPQERNHFTGDLFDELERNWVNCPRSSGNEFLHVVSSGESLLNGEGMRAFFLQE